MSNQPYGTPIKVTKAVGIAAVTAMPAMQIQYCGPKRFASLAVASSGGVMTFFADDTAATGLTTADTTIASGATPGTVTPTGEAATFGALADIINASPNWRCFLVGVLPSTTSVDTLTAIAVAATTGVCGDNGLTLYTDAAVTTYKIGFAITNEKFTCRPYGGAQTKQVGWERNRKAGRDAAKQVINSLCYLEATITNAGTNVPAVSAVDEWDHTVETLITFTGLTTNTWTAVCGATPTPGAPYISAPPGKRLVVAFTGSAASTVAVINATGETTHLLGGAVPSDNYTGCV